MTPSSISTNGMKQITDEQLAALRNFANSNGRFWKRELNKLWERAAANPILHGLRNSHGPRWLADFRFPKT